MLEFENQSFCILRVLSALSLLSPKRQEVKFHPIVNLKPLNKFIKYEHFKMENLKTVRFLVRKGDYFIKLELTDAYLTVPICKSHQNYLRFAWRGRIFQFHCLAFGLSPAPRVFTKLLKVVTAILRRQGLR